MSATANARLGRRFDTAELRAIKRLWVRHSIAEERRDIDGLVATIAPHGEYKIWFDASALGPALGCSARETRDQG